MSDYTGIEEKKKFLLREDGYDNQLGFKSALVEPFSSKVEAAKAKGISENRPNYIVRGRGQPSKNRFGVRLL